MKIMCLIPPSRFSKNVVRDLIYGCWCKGNRIAGIQFPPISQLQIVALLRNEGHDAVLYDALNLQKNIDDIKKEIIDYDVVIILTSTTTINEDAKILTELKKVNQKLTTICYGSHPTFMPYQTLQREGIDIVVRKEPEFIIKDLVNALSRSNHEWKKIAGISFRENKNIISNPDYPFIENLDILPISDRALIPKGIEYFNPVVKRLPFTTMFTSRGCYGRCIFCTARNFYGDRTRFQSAERVVKEMQLLYLQGYREIFFRDEIFTVSKQRIIDICKKIRENRIDLSWICSSRIDSVDLETLSLMKEAGCHMIRFGVESGAQEILNNIKKGITIEQTEKVFEWTYNVGIDTHAHLMLGSPGETQETINKTIKFIREINPTIVTFGICTPYPGTELFEKVKKLYPDINDGSSCDLSKIHTDGFYNKAFTKLNGNELSRSIRRCYKSFYLRPSYIFNWFKKFKNIEEAKRVFLAGRQIVDFILFGENKK